MAFGVKNTKFKFLSFLLVLLMSVQLIPSIAFANEDIELSEDIITEFEYIDGELQAISTLSTGEVIITVSQVANDPNSAKISVKNDSDQAVVSINFTIAFFGANTSLVFTPKLFITYVAPGDTQTQTFTYNNFWQSITVSGTLTVSNGQIIPYYGNFQRMY